MGNFCGKKPQKSHYQYRDNMLRKQYYLHPNQNLLSNQKLSLKNSTFFLKTANMIPNINDDIINRLVDQWQGSVISYFKQRFKQYANNEDNSLDQHDFIKIFPQLASFPKNVKKKAFDFFDRDRNGKIDFKEFCQSLSVCCKSDINSKIYLLYLLFDTDNDKYLSRNEVQTMIKYCSHYIFKIHTSDLVANSSSTNKVLGNVEKETQDQQRTKQQQSQYDKLSTTQGNIAINDAYVTTDNIKILSKTASKEFGGGYENTASNNQDKNQKQQQKSQKEIQKKQQILLEQQEKETMAYLFSKKQDKIGYQTFYNWATDYFNVEEFFLMFELVPDPLLEREIIRAIIKEEGQKDRQINQALSEHRQKQLSEEQNQVRNNGNDLNEASKNSKKQINVNQKQQQGKEANSFEKLLQKERFTETIYVISWKWWFMWRYYINYAYKIKKMNTHNQQKMFKNGNNNNFNAQDNNNNNNNIQDKNSTNAVNYNDIKNNSPQGGVDLFSEAANIKQDKGGLQNNNNQANNNQINQQKGIGLIGEEKDDFSNIANNDSLYRSKDYFDNNSPQQRDSNHSRNSMVDLEFNNSIPSERQEEQKVKYHLKPNAFKNNLEINMRNILDNGLQNDIHYDAGQQQQNQIRGNFQNFQNSSHKIFGGEEDIISDQNLFRPYSPSKVNHDLNNLPQTQQIIKNNIQLEKIQQSSSNENQFIEKQGEDGQQSLQRMQTHNQPQESQVKSVSHHHQFQQQGSFFTPRQNQQQGNQNYQQETSGNKQIFSSNAAADRQFLNNQNNTQRDINDSDLFQNPNWNNQQYENSQNNSPTKYKGITNPQQTQNSKQLNLSKLEQIEDQNQNLFNYQGQQLLNFPDTPSSVAGIAPFQSNRNGQFENNQNSSIKDKSKNQVETHNFVAHQNETELISQNNSNNNHQFQQYDEKQQQQINISQKYNDVQTMYNEVLHPETRGMNSSIAQIFQQTQVLQQQQQQVYSQQLDKYNSGNEGFDLIQIEQSERVDQGQSPQEHVQQYIQKSVYAGQNQNERSKPTVNPNVQGGINQIQNKNDQQSSSQQIKNGEQPSTLFSQIKFNICKPLQGLKGETHDLLSQDDLSKSNIAAATNKNINNNTQFEQSQFARECQNIMQPELSNQTSISPKKTEERINSPEKQQNLIDINQTTILTTQNNIKKTNEMNFISAANINTDKILHDDYMDEIDKGIQNTEEFGDHEEEEDHKKVHDDRFRFQQYSGHNLGDRPTQIDNTDIEGEFQGELQKNILKNNDYVIIPEKAWEKLFAWYSGGPIFKRKRIVDIQKNYKTVELYPPLIIGYKCRKNGEINYDTRQELMVSSQKKLKDVMKKFQKYFKSEKQEDILYYKKMGSQWVKATDLDKTMIVDLQIESGTIFLFLNKVIEEKFLERQRMKNSVRGGGVNTFTEILDTYEVGDRICVFHPSERIDKRGYIFSIKNDTIQIHFKRESYRNDIIFEKKKLEHYLKQESNQVSQINIDQSITHLNNHIKYNPKMIGLANLGNTCFINCIIQFLVHTPFFRQYLLDEIYRYSIKESNAIGNQSQNPQNLVANTAAANANNPFNTNVNSMYSNGNNSNIYRDQQPSSQTNLQDQQISLIHELSQLAKYLKQKPYNDIYDPVKPESLKKSIDKLMPNFSGHEQHDAQEFLQGFLDKLNDEIKIKKLVNINKPEDVNNNIMSQNMKQNNRTISNSGTQPLQLQKNSFSNNKDIVVLAKQTQSKYGNEDNASYQPPQFPTEPISNQPLQPPNLLQLQTDQITETNQNNKRESGDKLDNQITKPQQVYQEFSIIKDVYMGQTINTIQCSVCGNVNHKYEDFFTISLPLPIKNEVLYEVTYVPRISKGVIKPIKKYGIKVHRSATYGEFQQAFYKTSRINPSFIVFAEVYKNYVIKNFYPSDSSIPMRNLGIRSNDEITAFEVSNTNQLLEEEILALYPHNYSISSSKNIREGDFIDFNYQQNGMSLWMHGQVEKISISEQKNEQIVQLRLLDENLKQFNYQYKFKSEQKRIMPFRTQIPFYPKEKGFVIFLFNRRKINNNMERFGIPLCIIIPSWITWKELHLLVFSQVKKCIDFNYLIKKYQAAAKAQTKSKIKSAKTQGYTQLGGDGEEIDFINAAQTYQNDEHRSKDKVYQEQNQFFREYRQKAPSFHGFGEDQFQVNQMIQDEEYIRNRKSLINTQQTKDAYRVSSKSPQKIKNIKEEQPPQLRPTITDYQNMYKASTSTFIQNHQENQNGYSQQNQDGNKQSQPNNLKNTIKQSVNLEKNQQFQNRGQSQQQEQNFDDYYSAFGGEIKDSIDFLQSSYFPYKLRAIDQVTQRCIICDLPLIPDITQKESCQGCEAGLVEKPIFWDIKQYALIFTIDWKDSLSFNPSSMIPQNDESYIDLKKQKNEIKMGIPIQSCFDLFSAQEKVQLECDVCKINQLQTTKHLLYKLPNILIIHLSRFQYQNGLFEKIDDLVNFPSKKLDLSKWVFKDNKLQQAQQSSSKQNQDNQDEIYDLFAVVNHLGNGHGGHYTSFVNIKEDGSELKDCWVNFDDEQVNYISQEDVLSNKGYLLIYKKKFSTSAIVNLTYKKL